MDFMEAGRTVLEASQTLVKEGLVSRTWGNVSCRLDEDRFAITPSGISYERLTLGDIVLVNIRDLSHEGKIKPSSEKGIHGEAYRMRQDVAAVVHTHQLQASLVAASRREVTGLSEDEKKILGPSVRVADYALPGTRKLKMATARALAGRNAALLANHGAVCVGRTMDEAFLVARMLEEACARFIEGEFLKSSGLKGPYRREKMHEHYLKNHAGRI